MKKYLFLIMSFIFIGSLQAEVKAAQPREMQGYYSHLPSYSYCSRKLRSAGYLSRGRGSKNRNFMMTDACIRNGGVI